MWGYASPALANTRLEVVQRQRRRDSVLGVSVTRRRVGFLLVAFVEAPIGTDIVAGRVRQLREADIAGVDDVGLKSDMLLEQEDGVIWAIVTMAHVGGVITARIREVPGDVE